MKDESKHYPEFQAVWGKSAVTVAQIILALTPLLALWLLRPFWTQLIIAAILAFLMRKVTIFLRERLRLHRRWAALITTLLLLGILAIPILLFPTVVKSMQNLSVMIADFIAALTESIAVFLLENDEIIIGGLTIDLSLMTEPLIHFLNSGVEDQSAETLDQIISAVNTALINARSLVSLILTMFFIMSFTFYMLLDLTWLKRGILFIVPESTGQRISSACPKSGCCLESIYTWPVGRYVGYRDHCNHCCLVAGTTKCVGFGFNCRASGNHSYSGADSGDDSSRHHCAVSRIVPI
ncbi:MAG TPA: AI-2E family transporter [Anaerolineae bacterium]|nr:AI-2E family transporter [Anaerolineae bacterium]